MDPMGYISYESGDEQNDRIALVGMLQEGRIPIEHLPANMGLFLDSKALARILFMNHIYGLIVDIPGIVMDLGTRWGQNAALFSSLRGLYEPFNRHRKVVAFDTFTGFPSVAEEDGSSDLMEPGNLETPEGYADFLRKLLDLNEALNPISHIKKSSVVEGDCLATVPQYLLDNPETIVALAYFDFDIYQPTKSVLEQISTRLVRGSVLAFDELNDPDSPGETLAVMETLGLRNLRLRRLPFVSRTAYAVID